MAKEATNFSTAFMFGAIRSMSAFSFEILDSNSATASAPLCRIQHRQKDCISVNVEDVPLARHLRDLRSRLLCRSQARASPAGWRFRPRRRPSRLLHANSMSSMRSIANHKSRCDYLLHGYIPEVTSSEWQADLLKATLSVQCRTLKPKLLDLVILRSWSATSVNSVVILTLLATSLITWSSAFAALEDCFLA